MSDEFNDLLKQFEGGGETPPAEKDRYPILIIDDDDSIRRALSHALSGKYNVLTAESGMKGVKLLSEEIHCVILDVKMRDMNGFATYPRLKEKCPEALIIFYTAFQSEHDLQEVINKFKPEGYVQKGKDITFLENLIQNAVRKHQLILENEAYRRNLEEKVEQRTAQLKEQRDKANSLLKELQETQEQLIEAERRGAVYHLVAGVRHELNTHIQTLLANLQSLKYTDIDFVSQLLGVAEKFIISTKDKDDHPLRRLSAEIEEINKEVFEEIGEKGLVENIFSSIESAMNAARVIQNIINQLKDVSDHEEYEKRFEEVDNIIENTLKYLDSRMRDIMPNLKVIKEFGKGPLILQCNQYKIMQALTAQVMNSLDALQDKKFGMGEEPTLYFKAFRKNDELHIMTGDNGVGIDQEDLSNVFTPFFSKKGTGQKGTGLGLSQMAAIISKHNGRYCVRSEKGSFTEIEWIFLGESTSE